MNPMDRPRELRLAIALFLTLAAAGAAVTWMLMRERANAPRGPGANFCREAVVRAGVGHDLLTGVTRGRQGLVGSLYWAPLPTLLALPLLPPTAPFGEAWAFTAMALLGAAFFCAFLNVWLRHCGTRCPASETAVLTAADC